MVSLSAPELASLGHCIGMHKPFKERKLICSHPRNPGGRFESSGRKNPILCLGEGEATGSECLDEKYIELPRALFSWLSSRVLLLVLPSVMS